MTEEEHNAERARLPGKHAYEYHRDMFLGCFGLFIILGVVVLVGAAVNDGLRLFPHPVHVVVATPDPTASWKKWKREHDQYIQSLVPQQNRAKTKEQLDAIRSEVSAWYRQHPEPARPMLE